MEATKYSSDPDAFKYLHIRAACSLSENIRVLRQIVTCISHACCFVMNVCSFHSARDLIGLAELMLIHV